MRKGEALRGRTEPPSIHHQKEDAVSHPLLLGAYHRILGITVAAMALAGCSRQLPPAPDRASATAQNAIHSSGANATPVVIESNGAAPPAGLVPVSYGGHTITIWPYTGSSFDGVPSDPVNLIFVGHADPIQIRAALLALNGDRTAFGFPPVPPFNARWSDAIGDVQTGFADGAGWNGSVVQLELGVYTPIRTHLRLFRTGIPFGTGGVWTLGAAHFEVQIPGTTEHQVLSWELAQQLVTVDLIRSGLLATGGPQLSPVINQAPSFREIPSFIYNQLPPDLVALIQGPPQPSASAVPIASDGQASILELAGTPTVTAGTASQSFTIQFGQVIPKPLCSDGPFDWVYVTGPVQFDRTTSVDATGHYQYNSRVAGRLTVTPVDITTNPPTPVGQPFTATVSDAQEGTEDAAGGAVSARSQRIAPQAGGSELLLTELRVSSTGLDRYRAMEQCLQPSP
jgi:hypothetical protein